MLSLSGAFRNFDTNYGYGVAAWHILEGFKENGIKWSIDDPTQDIEIFWGHPPYEFQRSHHYKIGYTAWESTGFHPGWKDSMQDADEIWTPTPWLTEHFMKELDKPGWTYPHGISEKWESTRHYAPGRERPFTFLHIGEPQFRKNGQLVLDAFGELFGNDERYKLVMKTAGINTSRVYTNSGSILGTSSYYKNVVSIDTMLSFDQMLELHSKVDALVYPSAGEGFGFHPLEAMAAGLPTISTSNWAMYDKYITVPIEGTLSPSEWQQLHPGDLFNVTKDQVKSAMIDMVENYDKYSGRTYKNSFFIHDEYSWSRVNKKAAEKIKNIQNSRI